MPIEGVSVLPTPLAGRQAGGARNDARAALAWRPGSVGKHARHHAGPPSRSMSVASRIGGCCKGEARRPGRLCVEASGSAEPVSPAAGNAFARPGNHFIITPIEKPKPTAIRNNAIATMAIIEQERRLFAQPKCPQRSKQHSPAVEMSPASSLFEIAASTQRMILPEHGMTPRVRLQEVKLL